MTPRAEVLEFASEAEPILPSVAVVLREYAALLSSVEDGEGIVRELGGFTPGPWEWNGKDQLWGGERGEAGALEQILNSADDGKSYGMHSACIEHHWDEKVAEANRRLIAAAPTLLARIAQDAQEKAALQATLDEVSAAIGDVRYMDPPDGGDVPIAEQVRRMRAELASVKAERDSLGTQLEQIAHERTP